jgi:2-polyprenyl-6-methoxyphenol hydroxylase-like FAD-dependent oxidoreductase
MVDARRRSGGTVVVVGGSIAGSFAARVLSDHFERVLVLDKDDLPEGPEPRQGAMQGVHFHALLAKGRMVAGELFPGFAEDMLSEGAADVPLAEARVYEPYGWAPTAGSTRRQVAASRLLIEWVTRRRAVALDNVEVRPRTEVAGLLATPDGRRVTGARARPRDDGAEHDIAADLVVDASGRASRVLHWLRDLGHGEPETTSVNAHWGYASRFFRIPEGVVPPVVGGFPIGGASDGPAATRGGFLLRQERDRWLITLSGCAGDLPPGDDDGFLAFARTLAFPQIGEVIPQAEPTTPIQIWRRTLNQWRHFESLPTWPEAFVTLADAVCSFNPVYGQGMTVAALEALDLRAELEAHAAAGGDGHGDGFARRFQQRIAERIVQPWEAAIRSDYGVAGVEGDPAPSGFADRLAFWQRVVALGRDDPSIYERIAATNQLVITPEWLDDPELRARVHGHWDELGALVGDRTPAPTG